MHPATANLLRWFRYDHLPQGAPREVSTRCAELANLLGNVLPEGPELSAGLRHLLEAKDCFVRAALDTKES
jgi:hypothetical protein